MGVHWIESDFRPALQLIRGLKHRKRVAADTALRPWLATEMPVACSGTSSLRLPCQTSCASFSPLM
jgi:hypothetical protein